MKYRKNKSVKSNSISPHFSKRDFKCKCGHCENSFKISLGLVGGLEMLWSKLRCHIHIIKGYQCSNCASAKKNANRNYHASGLAVDLKVDKKSLKELFIKAEEVPEFKGIGLNISDRYVHVDTRKKEDRVCWIEKSGEKIELDKYNRQSYLENL